MELTKKEKVKYIRELDNKEELISFISTESDADILELIIKKLAQLEDESLLPVYHQLVRENKHQQVRVNAIQAITKIKDVDVAKENLMVYLDDSNPEVVLQAIRGLVRFKNDEEIKLNLHLVYEVNSNEIVREIIEQEYKMNNNDSDTKKGHVGVDVRLKNKVIQGDTMDVMKELEDNSIHLTFTSPPYYNARDYSIYNSYEEYLDDMEEVFNEVHRLTKDGRFLIVNTSPVIVPRVDRKYSSKRFAIPYDLHNRLTREGKWEFIDDIHWVKPDASVKNRVGGFSQFRKPLMYKPNSVTEQIMVYRKKSDRLMDWNIRAYSDKVVEQSLVTGEYDRLNVWEIAPSSDKTHSAVFPYELCERIVKYYSFKGDLVFDPFAGSGTLAQASLDKGRSIFMTEQMPEYVERIKEKLVKYEDVEYMTTEEFKEYYTE